MSEPGRGRVVALIAAYNEADVVDHVLSHLIAQGVEIYFLDDGSTDRTRAIAESFLKRGVMAVETLPHAESPRTFNWTQILERKQALAARIDADWFIHQDADGFRESPWPGLTLAEAIARVDRAGYNAIDFALFDFHPTGDSFTPGEDVRAALTHYENGKPWNAPQIKAWKKGPHAVDLVSSGGHDVAFPNRRVYPLRFVLRHYPIRSTLQGRRKIEVERVGRFRDDERAQGWHVQYDAYRPGDPITRDAAELRRYDAAEIRAEIAAADAERVDAERERLARECVELRSLLSEAEQRENEARGLLSEAERGVKETRAALDASRAEGDDLKQQIRDHEAEQRRLLAAIQALHQSLTWRATRPFRALYELLIRK